MLMYAALRLCQKITRGPQLCNMCLQVTKLLDTQHQELQAYIKRLLRQNERFLYTFQYVSCLPIVFQLKHKLNTS